MPPKLKHLQHGAQQESNEGGVLETSLPIKRRRTKKNPVLPQVSQLMSEQNNEVLLPVPGVPEVFEQGGIEINCPFKIFHHLC